MSKKKFKKVVEYDVEGDFTLFNPKNSLGLIFAPFICLIQTLVIICLYPMYLLMLLFNYFNCRKVYWEEIK